MAKSAIRRKRRNPSAGLIHLLNQRYRQEWERAEAAQGELDRLHHSPLGTLIRAMRWLKRRVCPAKPSAALAECATPYVASREASVSTGMVSIVIPFRDQPELLKNCLRSVFASSYTNFELVLVDNGSVERRTQKLLDRLAIRGNVRLVHAPGTFNFSKLCNVGSAVASGEFILFLNNDTEVLTADWLERLLRIASDPRVGIVGAALLYPDGTIQHAGLFPRTDGEWVHPYRGERADTSGDEGELRRVRCVPAVTAACMSMKREVFHALGGFDERFPTDCNDVDLCQRARARGLSVVITPHARLLHYEGLSRGFKV